MEACGGFAPLITSCSTDHTLEGGSYAHICTAGPTYTGTVLSNVTFLAGLYSYAVCHYEDGELISSDGESPGFVITPISFEHRCFSYDLGTETEGGSGSWGCLLTHD